MLYNSQSDDFKILQRDSDAGNYFDSTNKSETYANNNVASMSVWLLFVIGLFCGVVSSLIFIFCSKQYDKLIAKRTTSSRNRDLQQFLHDEEGSSDLSDIEDGWESDSDESYTSDESYAREHGYWINAMIQELAAYRPAANTIPPDILPPIVGNDTTSNSYNSSQSNASKVEKKEMNVHSMPPPYVNLETESDLSICEPWLVVDETKIHICKTVRRLLRIASDSFDYSDDSSDLSSITKNSDNSSGEWSNDVKSAPYNDRWMCTNDIESIKGFDSDASTVACANTNKFKFNIREEIMDTTMEITDSEYDSDTVIQSQKLGFCAGVNIEDDNSEGKDCLDGKEVDQQTLRTTRNFSSKVESHSFIIPCHSCESMNRMNQVQKCKIRQDLSAYSNYGMFHGREEI
mmetsp:Transcript_9823/g.11445  ORF Transcript_9823/g.11445 Transcript_9823/m.11445 type:complete len:403 (-) Transcript_9823:99-1307(-)